MSSPKLTTLEIRSTLGLAGLYSLRLFGMFLLLPILSVYSKEIPGGDNHVLIGLALGAYGLTQAVLQLPFGMLSDRIGRKKVIYLGLVLFALGSVMAALAPNIYWVIAGRVIQGSGAISAAITALLADLTREEHRTKAMAVVGMSIGVTFAVSLVAGPLLHQWIGVPGIFWLTAILSVCAIIGVATAIPDPAISRFHSDAETNKAWLPTVLHDPELLRMNFGVFALHAAQMAMFVVIPLSMKDVGLPANHHWWVYLPIVLGAFVLMVPAIVIGEKRNKLKKVFCGAIALMLVAQTGMALWLDTLPAIIVWLSLYFVAFNILEATQPSLVSKIAPAAAKGTAMGVYNTTQSLGIFLGGAGGGWLYHLYGSSAVFSFCAVLMLIWLALASTMKPPLPVKSALFHLGEAWNGDPNELSSRLSQLRGVREAVVMIDERVALLKVMRDDWDESGVEQIIQETN